MTATSEARALPFFTDLYGSPLESGFIYIGQAGLDPVAYPAVVTSDISGDVVVQQPVRTTHGHAAAAGSLIHLYVPIPYSITILDAAGRLVYASLNETDPVALAVGSSSVQSAADIPTLRARSRASTNQVWVDNIGMYLYVPTDNTSPESLPFIVVGNDGARYYLDTQDVNASWVKIVGSIPPSQQGLWLGWNNDGTGPAYITNNRGTLAGGFVVRTVNSDNTAEIGRLTFTPIGGIIATDGIQANADINAVHNLVSQNGIVALTAAQTRFLKYDAGSDQYQLGTSPLIVQGSAVVTAASSLANQQANGVGALALGSNTGPNPTLPGTWVQTGTANNSVFLYVRTA